MSQIDLSWLQTDVGNKVLQSVKHNGKLKNFGIFERLSFIIYIY
jgi:hypothetical protein